MENKHYKVYREHSGIKEEVKVFATRGEAFSFCDTHGWTIRAEGKIWSLGVIPDEGEEPSFMTVDAYLYFRKGYSSISTPYPVSCIRISLTVSCYAEAQRQIKAITDDNPNIVSYEMNIIER